ncbi:MAG TPA: carbohydrate binding family 9 domain-containing protein, partial [Saprospiraceae bacterium]|nr:carbohydrate binding family 9 domain-containing protein [Saprospiraceae bacterium]
MKRLLSIFLAIFTCASLFAQKQNAEYRYFIKKATDAVKIDGDLKELSWESAQLATDFFMILPSDTSKANIQTHVRMTYDDNNIYIAVVNEIPHKTYMVESLRRDWNFGKNDNFLLIMDTYNDLTNGFAFGLNAAGAQWDGQQYDGGPVNLSWDNKWHSQVKQYEDRWIMEAAIPFKSIRYNKKLMSWGVNFGRM